MTDWMMETLLWTAVLIALVLLVRRPISRAFGPQIAYALWALPALRLVLPPIELPAWMRLTEPELAVAPIAVADEPLVTAFDLSTMHSENAVVAHPAATDTTAPLTQTTAFDFSFLDTGMLIELGVAVWLIGAAIFLVMRFSAYFRLRDELLRDGREVGREGSVRFVETPGTQAPLAFGVTDKVVALPEGFLAHPDRQSRDLALAHELQHHRGGDLLANVLVQPLFAIHWWNPLGRYGWLALRRDQEAACDARVMASAQREEREVYANLIVSFAAGPNVALAAPMACPVLGEKSIIHRLRSLKMDNTNTKRRLAGKALLGAAVVALPMTASISYAASELPQAPKTANAPTLPSALSALVAPQAPTAPEAPKAPLVDDQIIVIDPDGEVSNVETNSENVFVWNGDEGENSARVILRSNEHSDFPRGKGMNKEELQRFLERSENSKIILRNRGNSVRFFDRSEIDGEGQLSEEQIEEILDEVREGLEEANKVLEELPEIIEKAQAEAEEARSNEGRRVVRVERSCKGGSSEIVTETEDANGVQVISICQKGVMVQALNGLREARNSLKSSDELSGADRTRAIREIDRVISRWEREAR
ncbi:M56 family metallopeptidase [uncultured Erythrobacter sp.]|uniref:M56 family metallopeptidase n=1 Tax=uncultured Erythrobacter sp. TaxID=263913 RepID=UPI00262E6E13|nr:M56 family metallopeptidase [uncultured Erythrobacter sp.]